MRILSYNILNGGEGRADPLGEIIQAQRPDVVCLVEADELTVVERIANRLDMDFVHAIGNKHAAALLSRWPIRESINHAPLQPKIRNSLLEATVLVPDAQEWTFGLVHLHAHAAEADEAQREEEIGVVLDLFLPHRASSRPHFLVGDFNANAPRQQIDPARCKPSTRKEWDQNGGQLPRRVIQRMLDAGYVDSLDAAKGPAAGTMGTFSTQFPGQRVDYIFAHGIGPRRITDAWVEQDRLAQYASDHYPVGAEVSDSM